MLLFPNNSPAHQFNKKVISLKQVNQVRRLNESLPPIETKDLSLVSVKNL